MSRLSMLAAPLVMLAASQLAAAPLETRATAMPQAASPSYGGPSNAVAAAQLPCARVCMEDVADYCEH